jgi:hypothetical protein
LLLLLLFLAAGAAAPVKAQNFAIEEVAMCGLVTPGEINQITGLRVAQIHGGVTECTWELKPSDKSSGSIRVLARREFELPNQMAMESISNIGPHLGKMGGAGSLIFGEIDKGVPGVHEDCGFWMFSLELLLTSVELDRVGRELGKRALRRFNDSEEHCFVAQVLERQYPGDW